VIKTMHAGLDGVQWERLQQRAVADPRLILIDGILPREELVGLYGCADVLISLHRAEGYGRVLAEALQLGLQVVATDYSGNCDFCIGTQAHPVPYTLVPVQQGHYPHHAHQHWAEADPRAAVQALRAAVGAACKGIDPLAAAAYGHLFNPAAIGARYKQRLQTIWSKRHQLPLQHRFEA
jgi:glycosyltransferase involved in cell wall biosynthesis